MWFWVSSPCDAMRIQKGRKCTEMSAVNLAHQTGFLNSVYFHFAFCTLKHSITTPSVPIYFSSLITVALQKKDHKRRDRDRMQLQSCRSVGGTTRRWKSLQRLAPEPITQQYQLHEGLCRTLWDVRWLGKGQSRERKHRLRSRYEKRE